MKVDNMNIPYLFRCPISLDLFTDPVTLSTGQTYDRSNIEKWFSAGNLTCPVTMQKLQDPSLVPNHTLKDLIHQWLNNQIQPQHLAPLIDPNLSLTALKHHLESQDSSTLIETLATIKILSQELGWRRSCLHQLGFFPLLLQLLFGNPAPPQEQQVAELALQCLINFLPFAELASLSMLKESSHLATFLVLLTQPSTNIKINMCYLVEAIALSSETRDLCLVLGQSQCILRELIAPLHQNTDASEAASKALSTLCSLESNRENVVRQGGVDGLISYLSRANKHQVSVALATLELLLELASAKEVFIDNPNGVNVLVKMVFRVSDHEGSQSAVNLLSIICYGSLRVREEAIRAGVLTQLLLILQSQCSCRVKNKATMLLKLLRSMGTKDTTKCNLQYGLVDA